MNTGGLHEVSEDVAARINRLNRLSEMVEPDLRRHAKRHRVRELVSMAKRKLLRGGKAKGAKGNVPGLHKLPKGKKVPTGLSVESIVDAFNDVSSISQQQARAQGSNGTGRQNATGLSRQKAEYDAVVYLAQRCDAATTGQTLDMSSALDDAQAQLEPVVAQVVTRFTKDKKAFEHALKKHSARTPQGIMTALKGYDMMHPQQKGKRR